MKKSEISQRAINLVRCVEELALAMGLNVFIVTDGAMGVVNSDNKCIETMLNEYVKIQEMKCLDFKHGLETMEVIHKKTGNVYHVLSVQAIDCTNERDGLKVVVYSRDGMVFVRDEKEFWEKFRQQED